MPGKKVARPAATSSPASRPQQPVSVSAFAKLAKNAAAIAMRARGDADFDDPAVVRDGRGAIEWSSGRVGRVQAAGAPRRLSSHELGLHDDLHGQLEDASPARTAGSGSTPSAPPSTSAKPSPMDFVVEPPRGRRMRRSSSWTGMHFADRSGSLSSQPRVSLTAGLTREERKLLKEDLQSGPEDLNKLGGLHRRETRKMSRLPGQGPGQELSDMPASLMSSELLSSIDTDGLSQQDYGAAVEAAMDEDDGLANPSDDLKTILDAALNSLRADVQLLNPLYDPPAETKLSKFGTMTKMFASLFANLSKAVRLARRVIQGYQVKAQLQNQAQKDKEDADNVCSEQQASLRRLQVEMDQLEQKNQFLETKLADEKQRSERTLEDAQAYWESEQRKRAAAYATEKEELAREHRIAVEQARKEGASKEIEPLLERITVAENEAFELRSERDEMNEQMEKMQQQLEDVRLEAEDTVKELTERLEQQSAEQAEAALAGKSLLKAEKEKAELAEQVETLSDQLEHLQLRLGDSSSLVSVLESKLEAAKNEKSEADKVIAKLTESLTGTEAMTADLKRQLAEQEQMMQELKESQEPAVQQRLAAEMASMRAEIALEQARKGHLLRVTIAGVFATFNERNLLRNTFFLLRRLRATRKMERRLEGLRQELGLSSPELKRLRAEKEVWEEDKARMSADLAKLRGAMSSKDLIGRELSRQSEALHAALTTFSKLFRNRFRMRSFNAVRLVAVCTDSPLPIPVQVLRMANSAIGSFSKLLSVEAKLSRLRLNVTVVTVAERLRLARLDRRLESPAIPARLRGFFERQRELLQGQLTRRAVIRTMIDRKKRGVWGSVTEDAEQLNETCTAVVDRVTTDVEESRQEMSREDFEMRTRVWRCAVEMGECKWVVVAGERKMVPLKARPRRCSRSPPTQPVAAEPPPAPLPAVSPTSPQASPVRQWAPLATARSPQSIEFRSLPRAGIVPQVLLDEQQQQQQQFSPARAGSPSKRGDIWEARHNDGPACSVHSLTLRREPPPVPLSVNPAIRAGMQQPPPPLHRSPPKDRPASPPRPAVVTVQFSPPLSPRPASAGSAPLRPDSGRPASAATATQPLPPFSAVPLSRFTGAHCVVGPLPVSRSAQRKMSALCRNPPLLPQDRGRPAPAVLPAAGPAAAAVTAAAADVAQYGGQLSVSLRVSGEHAKRRRSSGASPGVVTSTASAGPPRRRRQLPE